MANEKLTESEAKLAKRAGKGGRAFVLARRKQPGLTLLEYQVQTDADAAAALTVGTTAGPPVEAAPVPDESK